MATPRAIRADAPAERMLLFHVGERRLASNLLHAIMGRYVSGAPQTVSILSDIQRIAGDMRQAIEQGTASGSSCGSIGSRTSSLILKQPIHGSSQSSRASGPWSVG